MQGKKGGDDNGSPSVSANNVDEKVGSIDQLRAGMHYLRVDGSFPREHSIKGGPRSRLLVLLGSIRRRRRVCHVGRGRGVVVVVVVVTLLFLWMRDRGRQSKTAREEQRGQG